MIVFVHGVPETSAVWRKVRGLIDRPSVAVALPGFGCDIPAGFGATKDDYVAWLLEELDQIDEPIDLVGHDWGAGLTYRIATTFPHAIRSWVADIGNIAHPDYEWHDFGRIWMTPGDGEAYFEAQLEQDAEQRAELFEAIGLDRDDAIEMATAGDELMGRCILSLYRSAAPNAYAHWGPWEPTSPPGMILNPSDDIFGDATMAAEVAAALGARYETIDGAGHFWPYEAPAPAARLLEDFWTSSAGDR